MPYIEAHGSYSRKDCMRFCRVGNLNKDSSKSQYRVLYSIDIKVAYVLALAAYSFNVNSHAKTSANGELCSYPYFILFHPNK